MVDYHYKAKCVRVVDGDTVDLEVDVGFKISIKHRFRLAGINAPEMRYEEGKIAKAWLKEKVEGKDIEIFSYKDADDKYGRYLATLILEGKDLNLLMVDEGFAEFYKK